jgi:hypothetical protein
MAGRGAQQPMAKRSRGTSIFPSGCPLAWIGSPTGIDTLRHAERNDE